MLDCFLIGLNASKVLVVRLRIKSPPRFQKVLQVVPAVNEKT